MQNREYEQQYKQTVINFFNGRTSYDNDHTIQRALPLLELVQLQQGQQVLDIATGTGIIAVAAAQTVGSEGKVVGVDFASGMLNQAKQKIAELGLHNVELIEADAEHINFDDESFDIIFCSSAIVYFKHIPTVLKKWHHWLKKGGFVAFSGCSEQSCEAPLIIEICARHGIELSNINEPIGTPEKCQILLKEAGFQEIGLRTQQFGFYRSVDQARVWNGGWFHPRKNPLLQLTSQQIERLGAEYRQETEAQTTERGVWYESMTFFAVGQKVY